MMPFGIRVVTVFVLLLLAIPPGAAAQGARKAPRLGMVIATSPTVGRQNVEAFRRGLQELGYVDGHNIVVEERWADGNPERVDALVYEVLRSNVDLLVVSSAVGARAARKATTTTPIVFVAVTDPAGTGVVNSLAHPGGNLTGTSLLIGEEFAAKWVELVKESLPRTASVAALRHTEHPMARKYVTTMATAARTLGLTLHVLDVRDAASLDDALSMIARRPPGALIVPASPLFAVHRKRIADFALSRRIPTVGYDRSLVADGMLMSYGPSIAETYRRGALYVDKILKGARPADLPVEQPTTFELVLNVKTVKALGLTLPASWLSRVDHTIE